MRSRPLAAALAALLVLSACGGQGDAPPAEETAPSAPGALEQAVERVASVYRYDHWFEADAFDWPQAAALGREKTLFFRWGTRELFVPEGLTNDEVTLGGTAVRVCRDASGAYLFGTLEPYDETSQFAHVGRRTLTRKELNDLQYLGDAVLDCAPVTPPPLEDLELTEDLEAVAACILDGVREDLPGECFTVCFGRYEKLNETDIFCTAAILTDTVDGWGGFNLWYDETAGAYRVDPVNGAGQPFCQNTDGQYTRRIDRIVELDRLALRVDAASGTWEVLPKAVEPGPLLLPDAVSAETPSFRIDPQRFEYPRDSHGNYAVVDYPRVTGLEDTRLQERLNDWLLETALRGLDVEAWRDLYNMEQHTTYTVTCADESLVSILFHFDVWPPAKAFEYYEGLAFSPRDGTVYTLGDLVPDPRQAFFDGAAPRVSFWKSDRIAPWDLEMLYGQILDANNFYLTKERLGFIVNLGGPFPNNILYEVDRP